LWVPTVTPCGDYTCTALSLTLNYCTDGPMIVVKDRNMELYLHKKVVVLDRE